MCPGNIEKLVALLKTDEEGEEIAAMLHEFLIDDRKKRRDKKYRSYGKKSQSSQKK